MKSHQRCKLARMFRVAGRFINEASEGAWYFNWMCLSNVQKKGNERDTREWFNEVIFFIFFILMMFIDFQFYIQFYYILLSLTSNEVIRFCFKAGK